MLPINTLGNIDSTYYALNFTAVNSPFWTPTQGYGNLSNSGLLYTGPYAYDVGFQFQFTTSVNQTYRLISSDGVIDTTNSGPVNIGLTVLNVNLIPNKTKFSIYCSTSNPPPSVANITDFKILFYSGVAKYNITAGNISCVNIGIGTSSPAYPLEINNTNSYAFTSGARWVAPGSTIGTISTTASLNVSLKATGYVWAGGFVVESDNRIKTNICDIDNRTALDTVRLLQPKTYNYIDTITKTNETIYGFSAQQVRSILPYATGLQKEYIPNIFCMVTVGNNGTQIVLPSNINTSVLQNQTTDGSIFIKLCCYLDEKNTPFIVNVKEIIDDHTILIDTQITSGNTMFLYGQEVNDFHTLNKDTIWTVATAALQDVDRQLQETRVELEATRTELAALKTEMIEAGLIRSK